MSPIVKTFLSVSAAYLLDESRGRPAEQPHPGPRSLDSRPAQPKKTLTAGPRSSGSHPWDRQGLHLG